MALSPLSPQNIPGSPPDSPITPLSLPPPGGNPPPDPTACEKIWAAVCQAFRDLADFFRKLFGCYPPEPDAADLARAERYRMYTKVQTAPSPILSPQPVSPIEQAEKKERENKLNTEPPPKAARKIAPKYPPVQPLVEKFSALEADLVFEKCAKQPLEMAGKIFANVPQLIEPAINITITAISSGVKTLAEQLKTLNKTPQSTEAELKERSGLPDALKRLLEWLMKDQLTVDDRAKHDAIARVVITKLIMTDAFKKQYADIAEPEKYLGELIAGMDRQPAHDASAREKELRAKITAHQTLIYPLLNWLVNIHTNPMSLDDFCQSQTLDVDVCKNICDEIFKHLLKVKTDHLHSRIKDVISENKLPEIVQKALRQNFLNVSGFAARRAMELVDQLKFDKFFDQFIDGFSAQEDDKKSAQEEAQRDYEIAKGGKTKHQDYAALNKELQALGKDEFLARHALVNFLGKKGADSRLKGFLQHIEQDQKIAFDERAYKALFASLQGDQKKPETNFFNQLAEEILKLMLPEETIRLKDGEVATVKGVQSAIYQLEIPKEVNEMLGSSVEMLSGILPEEHFEKLKEFLCEDVRIRVEKSAHDVLHDTIVYYLGKTLEDQFKKVTEKDRLKELFAYHLFPPIRDSLVGVFAKQTFSMKINELAPSFADVFNANSPEAQAKYKEEFLNQWFNITKGNCITFKLGEGQEAFNKFVNAALPWLEQILTKTKETLSSPGAKSVEQVTEALKKYFEYKDNYPPGTHDEEYNRYWKVFETAAFQLAEIGGLKKRTATKFNKEITGALLNALHDIRRSPEYLANVTCQSIDKSYGTPEGLMYLVSGVQPVRTAAEVHSELEKRVGETSQLIYDLMIRAVKQQSGFGAWALSLGLDEKKLQKYLLRIIKNGFGNSFYNANLFLQIISKATASLEDAHAKVDHARNLISMNLTLVLKRMVREHHYAPEAILGNLFSEKQILERVKAALKDEFYEAHATTIQEMVQDILDNKVEDVQHAELAKNVDWNKGKRLLAAVALQFVPTPPKTVKASTARHASAQGALVQGGAGHGHGAMLMGTQALRPTQEPHPLSLEA